MTNHHLELLAQYADHAYDMLCIEIESREDGYAVVRVSDRYGFIKAYAGWNGFAAYELLNEENLDVRGRT